MGHGPGGELGKLLRIDTDRKYFGAGPAVLRDHYALVHDEPEIRLRVGQEVLAILVGLKADEIVGQHCLDQRTMMRHAGDHRARGPWRVHEKPDRLRNAEIAQFRGQRKEVVVLDPEHRIRLLESQQRARHEGVYFAIAGVIFLGSADQVGTRVQRRPQRRIRKAFIIAFVMRGRQVEHRERARTQRLDFGERFLLVPVADPSAGTDPDRARLLDNRQQRRRKPTGHGFVRFGARHAI
jgi:hypothetical protein